LLESVSVDATVLAFSVVAAVACGLLFGAAPALQVASVQQSAALKEMGRGTSDSKDRAWLRGALVVAETALACILFVGAGLLMRSFWTLLEVSPGFRPERLAAWQIDPQQGQPAERFVYLDRLSQAVESIPGVVSAGLADTLPLGGNRSWGVQAKSVVYADGENPIAFPRLVDSKYFETMGIAILKGRGITEQDDLDHEPSIVVNETLAKSLWPSEEAIGKVLIVQGIERVVRGVVADVRHSSLEEDSGLEMYIPLRQTNWTNYTQLIIRSNLPLEALTPAVRQRLAQEDPLLPTTTFRSLEAEIERSLSPRKFTLWLIGAFSIAALLLASLGIYGVVSYSVNQRTQEIGIRMTLGASAASVRSQVIGRTVKLASVGIAVGVAAALLLGRTMSSLLYGISATDPWTFAAMTGLLLIVAALAGSIPARRISRTDLASVLRSA
jgi:predicted permease